MTYERLLVDPEIATLAEVMDPAALVKHFGLISRAPWNGGEVEEAQVARVLKHHAGKRCTLEIGVRSGDRWHFLIGKVYHKDRSKVFQVMEGIQAAGFGPQDEYSIPQPVAYMPSLRLLLQEKVEGPLAKAIFETGDRKSCAAAAERCGLWLARFHALAPKVGKVCPPDDDLKAKSVQRFCRKTAEGNGHFGDKAGQLLERLEKAASSPSPVEMCAGHGGYGATHVILAGERTVVFDWDQYDIADPARDVARFLTTLRRRALGELGSIHALDEAGEVFRKAYLAEGQPGAGRNLRFYEAATYLRLATRHLSDASPLEQEAQEKGNAMLDEVLRLLEQEAA